MAKSQTDVEKWADIEEEVSTVKGTKIRYLKKLPLEKEIKLRAILKEKLPLFSSSNEEEVEKGVFSFVMEELPKLLPIIVAVIIDKTEQWVLKNLDRETAEKIAAPFFESCFRFPEFLIKPREARQILQSQKSSLTAQKPSGGLQDRSKNSQVRS